MKTIAILGATSHIAKGLIDQFSRKSDDVMLLFARDPRKVKGFLKEIQCSKMSLMMNFAVFGEGDYDVIINCVGIRSTSDAEALDFDIFDVTEQIDNMILKYMQEHKETLYINFSSGAVYGGCFEKPVDDQTKTEIDANNVMPEEYYGIARRNSEAKHRALKEYNIADLRIFSYFSRFIDLNTGFLLSEVARCALEKKQFVTTHVDIVRDYIHPDDLYQLVRCVMSRQHINDSFDVYSKKSVKKCELLTLFEKKYALNVVFKEQLTANCATGFKNNYYSLSRKAKDLGYCPKYTSLQTIDMEFEHLTTCHH